MFLPLYMQQYIRLSCLSKYKYMYKHKMTRYKVHIMYFIVFSLHMYAIRTVVHTCAGMHNSIPLLFSAILTQ